MIENWENDNEIKSMVERQDGRKIIQTILSGYDMRVNNRKTKTK